MSIGLGGRFFLIGVAQVVLLGVGAYMLLELVQTTRPTGPTTAHHEVVAKVEGVLASPEADRAVRLQALVDEESEWLHSHISVIDPDNRLLALAHEGGPGRGGRRSAEQAPLQARLHRVVGSRPPRPLLEMPLTFPDGRLGAVRFLGPHRRPPPPPPGWWFVLLALAITAIGTWWMVRMVVSPIRRVTQAAAAFGKGDLGARTAVDQRDELGDLAAAFDRMATQVQNLVGAERELLANIAHELRTPLARIRVALELAEGGDVTRCVRSLADITEDLGELETIVTDSLATARLNHAGRSGESLPIPRRTTLGAQGLIDDAARRFRARCDRTLQVDAELAVEVNVDRVLVLRALGNLLDNAHKYTPDRDLPILLTAYTDEELVIEVRDRGVGISASHIEAVRRPFFRVDPARNRMTGGVGLGLALATNIIESHGGTLTIASEVGSGTTVTVRLPVR